MGNTQGGEYYAAGVGSAITGRGADLLIIDDPHTEQDAMNQKLWKEPLSGILQDHVNVYNQVDLLFLVMTRWNTKDLTGAVGRAARTKADQWEIVEFPAIMPSGKPLWPEYWKLEELEGVKASITCTEMECSIHAESNFRRRSYY